MQDQEQIIPDSTSELEQATELMDRFVEWSTGFAPKLAMAILILIIGFWLVNRISKAVDLSMNKAKMAPEVISFLSSLVKIALNIIVILIAAQVIGFEMSSLVAIIAAMAFAVGMALQGSLSNFAAGIMIIVFKPYKVDDWVEISERFGKVEGIQIFNTTIVTPGNKTHIIPNGQVVDGVITNFSAKGHIRLELNISMPYEESFEKVKAAILQALTEVPFVLKDPEPIVGIESYDSHNVIISIRPFIAPNDYWDATFTINSKIKDAFYQAGIKMAYSEGVELGPIGPG